MKASIHVMMPRTFVPGRAEEQRGEEGCHRSFAVLCGLVLIYRGPICRWGLRWTAVGEQGYCWTPWCGLSHTVYRGSWHNIWCFTHVKCNVVSEIFLVSLAENHWSNVKSHPSLATNGRIRQKVHHHRNHRRKKVTIKAATTPVEDDNTT